MSAAPRPDPVHDQARHEARLTWRAEKVNLSIFRVLGGGFVLVDHGVQTRMDAEDVEALLDLLGAPK
jgi:hypothetical protein